jgi:hypothetical protein
MITRKQYNEALDVIEEFQNQLFKTTGGKNLRNVEKTLLLEWEKLPKCSVRLKNGFWSYMEQRKKYKNQDVFYLEDISIRDFRRTPTVGESTVKELVELRGY